MSHPKVSDAPKDEAKEAVEKGAHQAQQIAKERNDLGDDEGEHPENGQNRGLRGPTNYCMTTHVSSAGEESEEDEASRHRGV